LQRAAYLELIKRGVRIGPQAEASTGSPLPGSELPWREWLARYFPHVTTAPMAARHIEQWEWFESLTPGSAPRPRVAPWPRGGGKSSTGELGCVRVGAKLSRRFVLFVAETQPQADQRVQAVATLFERMGVGRALGKYGSSKGWRRDQLRTENGFSVAGIGLDTASRGVKLDEFRPDLQIYDDIDGRHDTEATIQKKIQTITTSLLPAGSSDCAVLFLQNLIHKGSIVEQLVDGTAPFLHTREASVPEPALRGLEVDWREQPDGTRRFVITAGEPTWAGQNLTVCERQINDWGLSAFRREAQQEVDEEEGGLWSRAMIDATRVVSFPPLTRIVVAVDPNASEGGDAAGIVAAGSALVDGVLHGYLLEDATTEGGPAKWAAQSVALYNRLKADKIVAEANNGGDMVAVTIGTEPGAPPVKLLHASRGKLTRAEPVQKLYEDGRVHHVGFFPDLERELCTYKPPMPSPNRMDAAVWCLTELMLGVQRSGDVL
jgi:hypothetical protein